MTIKPEKELTPITVYIIAFVVGVTGCLFGEFILGSEPHPLHWISGVAGIFLGYLIGKLVVRKYGDIFGF